MAAIGGPIESISIAGREFSCPADTDIGRKFGGFENEHKPNGNGTARIIKSRVTWKLTGVSVEVDDEIGDHEYLDSVKDSAEDVAIVVTFVSGISYTGVGNIEGELTYSNNSAAASFDLAGPQKLVKM